MPMTFGVNTQVCTNLVQSICIMNFQMSLLSTFYSMILKNRWLFALDCFACIILINLIIGDRFFDYFNSVADAILSLSVNAEQNSRHQTLQRIKDYIQANLNRNLTLNEIASSVCYNSSHVSRFFHQMTGQTISQYILQQRMEEACRCLSCENDSIQAISEHLGFDSAQYFSNVFKKYTGVSPRDYRNGIRS